MLVGADRRRSVASIVVGSIAVAATFTISTIGVSDTVEAAFDCTSGGPSYTVRSGDGWFGIAQRVDVTTSALLDANSADVDDVLLVGDRLCLPAGADIAGACDASYTVRSGDGWFGIADRVGAAVRSLLGANGTGLDDAIHPGDVLCLPSGASGGGSSSSASSSSSSTGGSGSGGGGGGGGGGGATYTVVSGDSWFDISQRAGTSLRALLAANGASSGTVIVPGQEVDLPAGATTPTATSAPSVGWVDLEALPMQGPCGYADTWRHARGGGRVHLGTDLFTTPGNYIYAVVDGRLSGRSWDQPGLISGNSWTLTGYDGTVYYYGHLSDFNPALGVGSTVQAGEIIGWQGSTGNSSAPHLHFEIRPGGGSPINPYPILRAEGGCRQGTPYTQPSGWVPDRIG